MGTRAAFWVGDPVNLEGREWLGCIAWDGHPKNFTDLQGITTEQDFRAAVMEIRSISGDFAIPTKGWPFPWADDVFLTDCTYAFFDGKVQFCWFYRAFTSLADYLLSGDKDDGQADDPRHKRVPAPAAYDPAQPDSIMIISVR